jgi:hypothetical protein
LFDVPLGAIAGVFRRASKDMSNPFLDEGREADRIEIG